MKNAPGTYALLLDATEERPVEVGALGAMRLRPGIYLYVGSARGPGGVRARVRRHARSGDEKALHWHVDYLRAATAWREAWVAYGDEDRECAWARAAAGLDGAAVALEGFGASDCDCTTHCLHLPALPSPEAFEERLAAEGGRRPSLQRERVPRVTDGA
jgi:Uri superfamily endonuclease